ncbi:MAG TPA: carboxypeptidase-like regulatory domain-containing protein, partial [Acidobacteriota bacterium]
MQDENNSPLQGAAVRIESDALIGSSQTALTDGKGHFRFLELPPGDYRMHIRLSGYKTVRIEAIRISAGETLDIPVQLPLFVGEQSITVQGDSNSIDPTTSALSTVLPQEYLEDMPADRDSSHIL